MQRVTPSEPFNPDPDARYLRECSRPGPVHEPDADGHRPHVRHRFGDEPQSVVEDVAYDHLMLSACNCEA